MCDENDFDLMKTTDNDKADKKTLEKNGMSVDNDFDLLKNGKINSGVSGNMEGDKTFPKKTLV